MKQLFRNFKKQKTVGSLSIISLALGTMVAILVGLWVINELSFDSFHKEGDRIYRITYSLTNNEKQYKSGSQFQPLGKVVQDAIPEVEAMVRINMLTDELWVDNVRHNEEKLIAADSNFFSFFSFPLKVGNPSTVLAEPNLIVLDEATAAKLFPNQNPVGKTLKVGRYEMTVSGIMHSMPSNSHLQAGMVCTFFGWNKDNGWGSNDSYITYLQFNKNVDINELDKKIVELAYEQFPPYKVMNVTFKLQPLKEIHWDNTIMFDNVIKGNKMLLLTFGMVAAVILLLACINFSNLFTSSAFLRAKAVGIQRTQGADRGALVRSFYAETAYYVAISIGIGLLLAVLMEPLFRQYVNTSFVLSFASPILYLFLAVLLVVTVLLAGTLPAMYLTRMNPLETLGGKYKGKRISSLQKGLIVVQFTAAIALLIVSLFISKQVNYMLTTDLGFSKENIIYVYYRDKFGENFETLRNELMKEPSIQDVTAKNSLPTDWVQGSQVKIEGMADDYIAEICRVNSNYFDVMEMKFAEGGNPFILTGSDSLRYCVVNESLIKMFGIQSPVGTPIMLNDKPYTIHGVIRNAYVRSLQEKMDPQVYLKLKEKETSGMEVLLAKVTGNPQNAIAAIEKQWNSMVENVPFEYHFLDEEYENLYKSEKNLQSMLLFAMVIGFTISVAGLFAMAFYNTQRRMKEVAVRKVNGAETGGLIVLLNKEFLTWVLISFALACPISYFALQKWLASFTIQAALSISVFIAVGLVATLVALITVSWQTWCAATANPVEIIRRE